MRVTLYNEETCPVLDFGALSARIEDLTGLELELRGEFVQHWLERAPADIDQMAYSMVRARVADPLAEAPPDNEPMYAELSAEKRVLGKPGRSSKGILYNGIVVQYLMASLIDPSEIDDWHIILTDRLLGTFMYEDRRWHAHTGVYGEPCLISTSGLVQAPVRPKGYYRGQGLATTRMVPREVVEIRLREEYRDQMLLPDDPRLNDATFGHILQALAFHQTGDPFCEDPCCPLFNARRQEDLLRAHSSAESRLCDDHRALLGGLGRGV